MSSSFALVVSISDRRKDGRPARSVWSPTFLRVLYRFCAGDAEQAKEEKKLTATEVHALQVNEAYSLSGSSFGEGHHSSCARAADC